jgi:cytochrome b subunit of formate dehydrogenase
MHSFTERILAIVTGFLIFASYSIAFTKIEQSATSYLITYDNTINFPIVIGLYVLTAALFFKLIPWPKIKVLAIFALTLGI